MPPPRTQVTEFLVSKGVPQEEARLRAALTGGRPGAALHMDTAGGLARRDSLLAALEQATIGPVEAVTAADELRPRGDLAALLGQLAALARDLMVLPFDRQLLINIDRVDQLQGLARHISSSQAAQLLTRLGWCEGAMERNVNSHLMLQVILLQAGGHLSVSPLSTPWVDS